MIRAVIFDFGNVICRFDNRRFLEALALRCGKSVGDLQTSIYEQSGLPQAYEAGRLGSEAFRVGISALCGEDVPEPDFVRAYTDIFTPIVPTIDLIQQLKGRYRLGLISDTGPWHGDFIRAHATYPLFDAVTLSYEVGAMKPDPRLFEDALAKLGLAPSACVYIDDRAPFALAAARFGMHGIAYTTPEALTEELHRLGVSG